jgi:hypothetical protein
MKPKTHGKLETIPAVKLYREDLDEILFLFHVYCETVTISDANSEYESLDELRQHVGSRVRNIELAGAKPNITLTLMSKGSMLRHLAEGVVLTPEETDKADLLISRAKEFLLKRKRLIARILTTPFISIACCAVFGIGLFLAWRYPMLGRDLFVLVVLLGVPPILGIGVATLNGAFRYVTLDSRTTASSFWKRNRDQIKMLLIGGVVGSGFTMLVQWLSHRLFPPGK